MTRRSFGGSSRARIVGAVVAGVALAGGSALIAIGAPAQAAATDCRVTYAMNDWGGGFTTDVAVTNLGDPLTAWTLQWDFAGNQHITNAWNSVLGQSGSHVTLRNAAWTGDVPTGGSVHLGFQASYSGDNAEPARFELNGVACNGTPPPSSGPTSEPPVVVDPPVDNPYVGKGYVNPEWKAKADGEPGGSRVSDTPTAVWLDRIAPADGAGTHGSMGLRQHLDAALAQGADYAQFVLYDLPGRDCAGAAYDRELDANEVTRYKRDFVDPIAAVEADPKYRNLRIINLVEVGSLPDLAYSEKLSSPLQTCQVVADNGGYSPGITYALSKLSAIANAYEYLDAGRHGMLGWDDVFGPYAESLADLARSPDGRMSGVDGFIVNAADYSATVEPFFTASTLVGGTTAQQSRWVDWNPYVDEQSYALAMRQKLISLGFPASIGMLIDTSRNGWGGPARPVAAATNTTDVDRFVDSSRIDRRLNIGNWCNQSGAGLGKRPTVDPAPGIDAYVWATPPGESDGSSLESPNGIKGFVNRMCDPTYGGGATNSFHPSGALPDAPARGEWFPAQFRQLMRNAYPALQ